MTKGAVNGNHQEDTAAMLRAILEAASETAAILAPDGTFLEVNSAAAAIASADGNGDVRGRTLFDFIAPEDDAVARRARELLQRGEAGRMECVVIGGSGRRRKFEFRWAPLSVPPRQEPRLVLFSRDLTPLRTAERNRELLASLVDSSTDAVIAVDCNAIVTAWNRGAQELFGATAAQIIGKRVDAGPTPFR
jgi:PAS domain S-box-containing protein